MQLYVTIIISYVIVSPLIQVHLIIKIVIVSLDFVAI